MNNVIRVEFGKKNAVEQQEVPVEPSLTAYLDSLREMGVDDEDIIAVIDAINDMSCYFTSDEEVQAFADGWLHQFL